jgi:hypothetical protein
MSSVYGIINLSVVPVRAEASDRSEMVSQLLFGEHFSILSNSGSWRKIKAVYDGYEGWIDEKQFVPISEDDFQALRNPYGTVSLDLVQVAVHEEEFNTILLGSNLPFFKEGMCRIGDKKYSFAGHYRDLETRPEKKKLIDNAYMYLNAPYLWGGRSPFGIDCSGLTQMVYKLNGIPIPRDASQQALRGTLVNFPEEAVAGDLAFFDNDEGTIVHTGIILPASMIIHASGKVRIDKFDHYGIYNTELKKYTHKLRLIRKFV